MNYKQLLKNINTFIFDVDGVMTNGIIFLAPGGEMLRNMNVKDGYALQLAVRKGYRIIIISGGNSESVRQRFELLGVKDVFLGIKHKKKVYDELIRKYDINPAHILYLGDDIPDYEVMSEVGVATCPADAVEEIKAISKYISPLKGGEGCVRDVLEQVMKIQNTWFDVDGFHW
jgi:3-deoxy-D-manno-octulosonate 8-phosphate phosphatase (KDO 8-P phosphatase)